MDHYFMRKESLLFVKTNPFYINYVCVLDFDLKL